MSGGASWIGVPRHIPPISPVTWTCPRCHSYFSGPGRSRTGPPPSRPLAAPPVPPPCKNFPKPSDLPPPSSESEITAPKFSALSQVCLPTQASHCLLPSITSFCIGSLYSSKARSELSLVSASASRRLFCSAPLAHWAVAGCLPFRALWGTSMLHRAHRGWGSFPSSIMTTVSRTCRYRNCTRIAVLVDARPRHPSTGQLYRPPFARNDIWKVRGPAPTAGVLHLRRVSTTLSCLVIR